MVLLALLLAACAQEDRGPRPGEGAAPLALIARPLDLRPGTTDRLELTAALVLSAGDVRFGGWSGLTRTSAGTLHAVSDRGWWVAATEQRQNGQLVGFTAATLGPMTGPEGTLSAVRWRDAEELTPLSDGSVLVAFETEARLWQYAGPGGAWQAEWVLPPGIERHSNRGIEGMAALPDGRVVLFSEDDGRVWIGRSGDWRLHHYQPAPEHGVSAATLLPDGRLLLVERGFSPWRGWRVRLVLIRLADLEAGQPGEDITPALGFDNIEGVTAWRDADGRIRLWLISDDNYRRMVQQTQLLEFVLRQD